MRFKNFFAFLLLYYGQFLLAQKIQLPPIKIKTQSKYEWYWVKLAPYL